MEIRLAGLVVDSIVDGPGLRLAVFVQGCAHRCPGCHNPASHDPAGGYTDDTERLLTLLRGNALLSGITLSGGEPLLQPVPCLALAQGSHALGKNVWLYTGYTWEEMLGQSDPDVLALLCAVDVVVDGPFIEAQRTLNLRFRGSKNQRLLDAPASRAAGQPVPHSLPVW
ncbi:MAG: anaerobic ribonucleoside-triphosphate reductase activating protein [Oscillospiraceae bacterium]|jgi:anaerobic ribonucleoside-triphosphate reductase activating protein|nr:anaerobic ribonucleoside-triphosphate reductase activating protein [Oscillospiraceae bacterium]